MITTTVSAQATWFVGTNVAKILDEVSAFLQDSGAYMLDITFWEDPGTTEDKYIVLYWQPE